MNPKAPRPSPLLTPAVLVWDTLGGIMLGLGLAKVSADIDVIPQAWRIEHYELMLIGAGIALMLPTVVAVLKHVCARTERRRESL